MSNTSSKPTPYAWLILFVSACFLFYKYILQVSPAVMSHELMEAYHLNATGLGFLVSFYFYTYLFMQIPSGILLDKYGARKLSSLAILFCAVGIFIFSYTSSFAMACFARLLIGFGAAFATTSYMKLSSQYFPAPYFPFLSGLFGTACMTGAGTAGAPLAWLVSATSWRETLTLCGIIGCVLVLLFWLLVKDQKNPIIQDTHISNETTFRFSTLLKLFKSRSNWALILYGGLAFTPTSVFGGLWGVPYLMESYALPKTVAATSVSLAFFGFAAGGLVIGIIGRYAKKQLSVVMLGTSLAFVFLSIVLYVPHLALWFLNTCIFLFGLCSASFLLSYAIAKSGNPAALVGTVIGVINMGDPICGGIAEPLIGKVLDLHWQGLIEHNVRIFSTEAYRWGLSVLTAYLFLAVLCCFFIKETPSPASTHH